MKNNSHFDLIILGSGSTAFAAAISAAAQGKMVLMTEERTLGGTCLNRGCVPSKNLIEAAHQWHNAANSRFSGIYTKQERLDFKELIDQKDEIISFMAKGKYKSIVDLSEKIKITTGHASFIDSHSIEVNGTHFTGDQILIATGAQPDIPDIPGLPNTPYLTSDLLTRDEKQELKEVPEILIIIGGGYIALELGQMFKRFGSNVIILERSDHILSKYEPEIGIELQDLLIKEGVDIRAKVEIIKVENTPKGIDVQTSSGRIQGTHLLVATGRRPNTDSIGLERINLKIDKEGFILTDDHLRTNVSHIWAAGDVIKGQMATPVGGHDGSIVAHNAFSSVNRRMDHSLIPRAIFTDPQVAVVGLSEKEAESQGIQCRCSVVLLKHLPRAVAIRDTRGLIKMLIEKSSEQIIGVSILSPHASELIHMAVLAIKAKMTIDDLIDTIFVYPTFSEALKLVALSFNTDVSKLSCCAEGFQRNK
ncbi:MAG: mercury(II) reductase [Simkaniaceae bacterium]|nr:mercury(II) reductase [Candidatus Sacchlamyda saccharinae]